MTIISHPVCPSYLSPQSQLLIICQIDNTPHHHHHHHHQPYLRLIHTYIHIFAPVQDSYNKNTLLCIPSVISRIILAILQCDHSFVALSPRSTTQSSPQGTRTRHTNLLRQYQPPSVDGHLRPLLSFLLTAIHDSKHGERPSLSSSLLLLRSSSPSYSLFQSSQGQICPADSASTKHHSPFHLQAGLWSAKAVCGSGQFPLRNGCQFSQLLVCYNNQCYLSYLVVCLSANTLHSAHSLFLRLTLSCSAMCERQITVPDNSLLYCSERSVFAYKILPLPSSKLGLSADIVLPPAAVAKTLANHCRLLALLLLCPFLRLLLRHLPCHHEPLCLP